MSSTEAIDTATVVDTYFEAWNEADPARRRRLVERAFAPEGRHVDPLADVSGHAALDEMVAGVQARFPGHTLRRTSEVDTHNDQLRYGWELAGPEDSVVVAALDVVQLDPDGRFRQVAAFFGPLAPR